MRITAQLVDAASGAHLWAERYDRALEDVFAVQEEIAQSIVATVAQRVVDAGETAARRRPPEDIRAYDLFLKALRLGGHLLHPGGAGAGRRRSTSRRVAIDPTFARAYSGLAYIHLNRSIDVIAGVRLSRTSIGSRPCASPSGRWRSIPTTRGFIPRSA